MPKGNFSVARVEKRTRASVGKFERHIERKNESYENMNVDLSRTPMNVHFQGCGELTYNEHLDRLIADGVVSLKGLKPDATVFNEMILDVNTDYFERNGGYDFACRFYEEAFHFAEKLYGKDNIISAVMHADELNIAMTEKYGKPVYHYHLHIMALPVVDKEVRWSKRCKDPALVGTVKEVIHQVSHSKKWKSEKALDENGNPVLNSKGKSVYRASYSILQDKFYEYMKEAGFEGFDRGERGSTAENLTSLGYKIQQDEKRLADIEQKIARNLSLKRLEFMKRKKRSAEIILSLDELAAVLPDERYAPDVSDEDVGKLISKFLRSQEEYVRNVFIRKYFYFDSIREIAKRYSFTESKVKNMLFYTRNKLKDYLIKEGVEI